MYPFFIKLFLIILGGWVHSVAFSPSGSKVGWVAHDSSISVVLGGENAQPSTLPLAYLPFVSCIFVSEGTLVAGGEFSHWQYNYRLDSLLKKNFGRNLLKMKKNLKNSFQFLFTSKN